jgi:hypothetical protein
MVESASRAMKFRVLDAVGFSQVVEAICAVARGHGYVVPAFRSPPGGDGPRRWVRWSAQGAVVGIVRRARSADEVIGDVIDAIALVNDERLGDDVRGSMRSAAERTLEGVHRRAA